MPTLAYQVSQENGATVAQKIHTIFIDDIDGGDADGTVRFGLDSTEYEIDLNAGHAQALRDALAPYVRAARRVGGAARRPARGGRRAPGSGLNAAGVREWAKAQGIEVKDHGRVPADLGAASIIAVLKKTWPGGELIAVLAALRW